MTLCGWGFLPSSFCPKRTYLLVSCPLLEENPLGSIYPNKPLNAFIFNFFLTLSFPLNKKVLVVPSPPPSPLARSVPAARALLLSLKSGNKYRKKQHQVFMLSDGTKWAPETCQAEHYWVWTASRCCGECGGLLLWSLVPGRGGRAESHPVAG